MNRGSVLASTLLLLLVPWLPLPALASSKVYIVYMGEKEHDDPSMVTTSHHDVLASVLGSKEAALKSIVYSYKHGFSGFAAMLTEAQAEELSSLDGVVFVKPDALYEMQTTRSWDVVLGNISDQQSARLQQKAKFGQDIIVGVVDSGIWPESRSFDDSGYGPVPARWKGECQTGEAFNATSCNRKIVGARWYTGGVDPELLKGEFMSPRDHNGHGTHVASTIAGSPVRDVSYYGSGLAAGVARGGAPRARLAVYKACWGATVWCSGAALLAAIDDATNDGVDVLSLSLGGFQEFAGTLHAVARGVPVVFAGMNRGPAPQTVRNTAPWLITVAASMMDRSFPTKVVLGNNEELVGQSRYVDATVNTSEFLNLVHGFRCDNASLASVNATGKVVLCYAPEDVNINPPRQGFFNAISNVKKVGARGLIFAGYSSNVLDKADSCNGVMPCVLVDFEIANRIAFYMINTRTPVVRISPATTVVGDWVLSPRIASFSSRGPSVEFPAILKPDIAAPGVSILAAVRDSYEFMSGTSMACPHVSGVVALLKSVHPEWSPAMIKSAIVTTASTTDRFGMPILAEGLPRKPADPFDMGGGHIEPDRAADPGLVYDVDPAEYTRFFRCTLDPKDDCSSYMGRLYQLNLPSIAVPDLVGSVTVSRTVTNVGPAEVTYRVAVEAPAGVDVSVEPTVMTFAVDASRNATFKATLTARQMVQGVYTFGSLAWSDDGGAHSVRIPIAVRSVIQDFVADVS
ncbi:subtilisin-like protease SBT3.9 [Miscanthus floridulus]|uniref:subtilisin-like protease SBT3.9 n=1 Tax=Miscanthus floridulus TaxID=154761 RepID=UPI00345953D6